MVADGLGHGMLAAQASEQAVQIFESSRMESVTAVMEEIDLPAFARPEAPQSQWQRYGAMS